MGDEVARFVIVGRIEQMKGIAVAAEEVLQPDDVPGRCGANQHGPAGAALNEIHATQNERAHDALAQIRLRDQQRSNPFGRDQQCLDIALRGCVDQRRPGGELSVLGQELTGALLGDRRDMAQTVVLRNRHCARQDHKHAGRGLAGFVQFLAAGVFAHGSEAAQPLDLVRRQGGKSLIVARTMRWKAHGFSLRFCGSTSGVHWRGARMQGPTLRGIVRFARFACQPDGLLIVGQSLQLNEPGSEPALRPLHRPSGGPPPPLREGGMRRRLILPCACKARGRGTTRSVVEGAGKPPLTRSDRPECSLSARRRKERPVAHANGDSNCADLPSSASISRSRLYLAMRSLRLAEPVLICPPPIATVKSARNASSVSPERCDTTVFQPALRQRAIAWTVSVTVPIWFNLIKTAFAAFSLMPRAMNSGLVTNISSPTIWMR